MANAENLSYGFSNKTNTETSNRLQRILNSSLNLDTAIRTMGDFLIIYRKKQGEQIYTYDKN
jgi:hypothetical protein